MTDFKQVFRGRRILITGGLGFIGSNLAHRLLDLEAKVKLVDSLIPKYGGNLFNIEEVRTRLQVNIADIRDDNVLRYLVQGEDYLFNLAGQTSHMDSMADPQTDMEINCRSQLSILEACRRHNPGILIVFASTRQIYGVPNYLPVDEKHPLCPVDVNGINKISGESYHILYNNVYGLRSSVLRLTNTYGPRMRVKDARQTFLGAWIRLLMEGKPIDVFGDGLQRRDFNYVNDVVEALLLCAANPEAVGRKFNLGAEPPVSLKELAALIVELHGKGEYRIVPFPPDLKAIDIGDYYADYRLIQSTLGWTPKISLQEGLARTLAFYKQYHQHYWDT